MIIYERDKKELIVPATFAGGSDSNCGPAIEKAYEEGWESGYASGTSECSGSCTIQQQKLVYVSAATVNEVRIYPDEGFDGVWEGVADISEAMATNYDLGHEDGWAEGQASGYADGYEQGERYGHDIGFDEGFSSGYTQGYEDGSGVPAHVSFLMCLSGTVVIDEDEVIDSDHSIWVFIGSFGALGENYVVIDGVPWDIWKSQGRTLSAGTHTFLANVAEYNHYDQVQGVFEVSYPQISQYWTNIPTFDVKFIFTKYR